jgi:hypothetical protein
MSGPNVSDPSVNGRTIDDDNHDAPPADRSAVEQFGPADASISHDERRMLYCIADFGQIAGHF